FKFNDWEMRGVPLRMEIGPRDVEAATVVLVRRDVHGVEGKQSVQTAELVSTVTRLLDEIQANMLAQATAFRDANLHEAASYDDLKEIVKDGWALIPHCGTPECEDRIKAETKASSRCFPLDLNEEWYPKGVTCSVCGKPAQGLAYFARAY
ncbi:proline--tRNA ligase, partial [Candidatus Bipolaricaulota bacterium]|nr:proline--tRNA ligase [Candidatus Bipolaricaulota bacterium]